MNPRAPAALGLALALALAGCVESKPNLFIQGLCGIPDDIATCAAPAGVCDTFLNGQLFVYESVQTSTGVVTFPLSQVAQVDNRSPDDTDESTGRVNSKDAIIERASLKFSAVGLAITDADVSAVFTPVPAGGTATIFLPLMSAATVAEIAGQLPLLASAFVTVEARLVGHYADGSFFETGPFNAVVQVVNDTFVPAGCVDPTQVRVFCYIPGQTGGSECVAP